MPPTTPRGLPLWRRTIKPFWIPTRLRFWLRPKRRSPMNERVALQALLRTDFRYFLWKAFQTILPGTEYLPNWHIDAIVHQLMQVHDGKVDRLLINQPP